MTAPSRAHRHHDHGRHAEPASGREDRSVAQDPAHEHG
jgi:hypothetical protein